VRDASQLKIEAERELDKIREDIERKKVTNIIYEDKLTEILNKHAPHNNLHIPYQEVQPVKLKLKEDLISENMSSLANMAKKFITKSEFVPIEQVKNYEKDTSIVNYSQQNDMTQLYNKLNQITELNNNINYKSKYNTLKKNYETDIHTKYLDPPKKEKSEIIQEERMIDLENVSAFPFDEN
jgi:hypothetical protein